MSKAMATYAWIMDVCTLRCVAFTTHSDCGREREKAETIAVSSWLIRSEHREIDLLDAYVLLLSLLGRTLKQAWSSRVCEERIDGCVQC